MKKILLASVLCSSLYCSQGLIEKLNNLETVKNVGVKVLGVQEYGDLYVLEGMVSSEQGFRTVTFTISKDLKYTFYGTAFDNETKEQIVFKKDMSEYIEKSNFTYGNGKEEYLLFTDPQCPYCVKFEEVLSKQNLKDKVKIHYYLFPLSHHGEAVPMSRFVLNQSTNEKKVQALYDISVRKIDLYKGAKYDNEKLERLHNIIEENKAIGEDLNIMGTPTLLDSNGQKVDLNLFFNKYSN